MITAGARPLLADVIPSDWDRFWAKVQRTESGCWLWTAAQFAKGYGMFQLRNRTVQAHRLSFAWAYGEPDQHLCVAHTCDTPACVNPAHLFAATAGQNNADRDAKGRAVNPRGERHGRARLSAEDVAEIRRCYAAREQTQRDLSRRYGVTQSHIWRIIHHESWDERLAVTQ